MRTTGLLEPQINTSDICNSSLILESMAFDSQYEKSSAQSPPCRRNALPSATSCKACLSFMISRGVTIGGNVSNFFIEVFATARSEYRTSCLTGFDRQDDGDQSSFGL